MGDLESLEDVLKALQSEYSREQQIRSDLKVIDQEILLLCALVRIVFLICLFSS
jgi:hypothetical protein